MRLPRGAAAARLPFVPDAVAVRRAVAAVGADVRRIHRTPPAGLIASCCSSPGRCDSCRRPAPPVDQPHPRLHVGERGQRPRQLGHPEGSRRFFLRVRCRAATGSVSRTPATSSAVSNSEPARGPRLPLATSLLPSRFTRLAQLHEGRRVPLRSPSARGSLRFCRLRDWQFDPRLFPDLSGASVLACMRIEQFAMTFPVARITDA